MPFASRYPEELSEDQRQELLHLLKTTQDVKVYRRAKVLLYLYQGRPANFIAKHTGYSQRSQYYWLRRYSLEGVDGLRDHPRSGRPLKPSPIVEPECSVPEEITQSLKPSVPGPDSAPQDPAGRSSLSEEARFPLQQMRRHHPKPYMRDRAQIVLLWDKGYSLDTLSDMLGLTAPTIRTVLSNYDQYQLGGLYRKPGSGKPPGLTPIQWTEISTWLVEGPKAFGYRFAIWTTRSLRYQIYKKFNRRFSREWIRYHLHHTFDYSWTRAKKVYAYLEPKKRQEFKHQLQHLLDQARTHQIILLFQDETLMDLYGSVGYSWSPVGQTQQVPHPGQKKTVVVFGAVNPVTGQSHYHLDKVINQDTTLNFLKQLQAYYHQHQPGVKLVIVQDKHPGHTAESVTDYVAGTDLLELVPTPTQSADLNPIERLWDWLKDQMIKNAFFKGVDEIKKAVRHFFSYIAGIKEQVIQLMERSQSIHPLPELSFPLIL